MRGMNWTAILVGALLASAPARAQEEAPEFLLGDIGVRVDLPRGWKMTRWSDWDFTAATNDGQIKLFAWATPIQSPIAQGDESWGGLFVAKSEELKAASPKLKDLRVEEVSGQKAAFVDLDFHFGEGGPAGKMYGSTVAVRGQMFHLATVASKARAKAAESWRKDLTARLDLSRAEPADVKWGPTLESKGITSALPDDWREPLKSEIEVVLPRVKELGIEDLSECWLAIRPRGAVDPDVMVTCQGGLLLGVVDSYSFEGVEPVVRERMFGKGAPVKPGTPVETGDRVGFLFAPELSSKGLAVGVVPYDQGLARTWATGAAGDATLSDAVKGVMQGSSYSGPHPAGVPDRIAYYVTYRPLSPVVLCPALGIVGLLGLLVVGGGVMAMRGGKKSKWEDLDD